MLLKQYNLESFEKLEKSLKNPEKINDNLLKLYKLLQSKKTDDLNLNFNNFIYTKKCTFQHLEQVFPMLDLLNIGKIIDENNFNEDRVVDFLIKNCDKKNFSSIMFFIHTKFKEENVKKLTKYYKLSSILENQNNIDFILKKPFSSYTTEEFSAVLKNENLKKEFVDKFLEFITVKNAKGEYELRSIIEIINEDFIKKFFRNIEISKSMVNKYKKIIEKNGIDLSYNKKLTEKTVIECIKVSDFCNLNEKVELSKGFIINNISYFTLRFVFTKIKKAEDVEQLIDLIINTYHQQKGEKAISNQVLKILNQIKRVNEDLDYDFYEKILEKYKIEISIRGKIEFFNHKTSEKSFSIIEKTFKKVNSVKEIDFYNENCDLGIFKYLMDNTNIPEKILVNYLPYFFVSGYSSGSYYQEDSFYLLSKQKIPRKIKTNKIYESLNISSFFSYLNHISDKKELSIIEKIGKTKLDLVVKPHNLMLNIDFLQTLNNKELMEMFSQTKVFYSPCSEEVKRLLINITRCIVRNNEKTPNIIYQKDFGMSF